MKKNFFDDPDAFPDENRLREALGENYKNLDNLLSRISRDCPGLEGAWKYYNDVKSWLFRMMCKKKTVFWMSVVDDAFRVTFYFNAKNEHMVNESPSIPAELKKTFHEASVGKKYKAMTIVVRKSADVDNIMTVADLKLRGK